ncbi:MAG: hypothetical protein JWM93_97 [Frankiales bacterium]|nr:hypothetical protein [Frankiales bacterium]
MSLLDAGRDVVTVYVEEASTDAYGTPVRVPSATGVDVIGRVQPVSVSETESTGQAVATVYRFIARDMPGGAFARVVWDDREWDLLGEPQRHNGSDATRHVTILLKSRGPAAL